MSERLDLIAEWIRVETERPSARSPEIVAKLEELARLCAELPSIDCGDERLRRALEAIQSALAEPWTVSRLAKIAGMSRAQFARRFTAVFGVSPREYLVRRRMARARDLLAETEDSLHAIGVSVGYESEFAFNRAFRRHHGVPPGVYRRNLRSLTTTSAVCLRLAA